MGALDIKNENIYNLEIRKGQFSWDLEKGGLFFFGIPSVLFWSNPSLLKMLQPMANEVGFDMFRLMVAYSSSYGTQEDYHNVILAMGKNFTEGFLAWGEAGSSIGWGKFELPEFDYDAKTAKVLIKNPWELYMQGELPKEDRWGCPFLQGKVIGIFTHALGVNCWADEKLILEEGKDAIVEFTVYQSEKTITEELKHLRIERMAEKERNLTLEVEKQTIEIRNLVKEIKEKNEKLTEMNISLERYMPRFILLISFKNGTGSTTIGNYFADALANKDREKSTVYLEYPHPERINKELAVEEKHLYKHPNGYDIWLSYELGIVPDEVKASLLMTKVLNNYNNIVINTEIEGNLEHFINNDIEPMIRYAKAIVLMIPPDNEDSENVNDIVNRIKRCVRQDKTNVYMLQNRVSEDSTYSSKFDFEIPFLTESNRKVSKKSFTVPEQAMSMISKLVDRIERVHQISVFIPTTVDVDKVIDTSDYVNRTLVYFGEKFGGATSSKAQGVWNSDDSGIVNETVYVIVSYTTEEDLGRAVDEVIEFVRNIKRELSQEAMAIEINRKMILV